MGSVRDVQMHFIFACTDSYPAGRESVVDSVVLLLVCSVPEVALALGSDGAARPRAS